MDAPPCNDVGSYPESLIVDKINWSPFQHVTDVSRNFSKNDGNKMFVTGRPQLGETNIV